MLWFLQPNSVLLSHRSMSEMRQGNSWPQKISSCFCWMNSSFLSHWAQTNIGDFKSFLFCLALDHIPIFLRLWSSSHPPNSSFLLCSFSSLQWFPFCTENLLVHLSQPIPRCILLRKTPLFLSKWLPEDMPHEEVIMLRRRNGPVCEVFLWVVKSKEPVFSHKEMKLQTDV